MSPVDWSVLPDDLAALYGGGPAPAGPTLAEQLVLPVEPAAAEFRRWLLEQPQPDWLDAA